MSDAVIGCSLQGVNQDPSGALCASWPGRASTDGSLAPLRHLPGPVHNCRHTSTDEAAAPAGPHQPAPRLDALFSVLTSSSQLPPDLPEVSTTFLGQEGDRSEPTRGPPGQRVSWGPLLRSFCGICSSPGPEDHLGSSGEGAAGSAGGRQVASRAAHPPSSAGEPSSVHGRKGAGERRLKTPAAWARACVRACLQRRLSQEPSPQLFSEGQHGLPGLRPGVPVADAPCGCHLSPPAPWGPPVARPPASQPPMLTVREHSSGEVKCSLL